MDLSPNLNEFETPFLVDSGTESYTESPVAEEDSEHSEDSTVCDSESNNCVSKNKPQLSIIDKQISVDDDVLLAVLEPVRQSNIIQCVKINNNNNNNNNNNSTDVSNDDDDDTFLVDHYYCQDDFTIPSMLQRESTSNSSPRKVSFPKNETDLVTYREPENDTPWVISTYLPAEKILQIYQASCKLHKTIELDLIKNIIMEIKDNRNHTAILNLTQLNITFEVNETLEDLLKVANFRSLILNDCKFTLETISEFLNMLEYYGSVCEIEICMDINDAQAWKFICNACSNMLVLESVSFKNININENYMRMLLNAVKNNSKITILKFDSCILAKFPSFYLVENLMNNTTIQELYLPSTGLYTKEADCLGLFLQNNSTLKVLDISNNCIGDRGLEALAKGLVKQKIPSLSILVIFNIQITDKSGPTLSNIIAECKNLHTLNIGYNNLTDDVLLNISDSLQITTSLEGLGLQSTLLTCRGMDYLAAAIKNNTSLKKINLKGNKAIEVAGLEKLCQALTTSKISKIEIDTVNRSSHDPHAYIQLVQKINGICTVNKTMKENSCDELSKLFSRKVSLSCELRYVTLPDIVVEEKLHTKTKKSRFHITKVIDDKKTKSSRFKVTPVKLDNDDDDDDVSVPDRFANVKSSVSSIDSVESLQDDSG